MASCRVPVSVGETSRLQCRSRGAGQTFSWIMTWTLLMEKRSPRRWTCPCLVFVGDSVTWMHWHHVTCMINMCESVICFIGDTRLWNSCTLNDPRVRRAGYGPLCATWKVLPPSPASLILEGVRNTIGALDCASCPCRIVSRPASDLEKQSAARVRENNKAGWSSETDPVFTHCILKMCAATWGPSHDIKKECPLPLFINTVWSPFSGWNAVFRIERQLASHSPAHSFF